MDTNTNNATAKTIVFLSRGLDDERATVAWTLANAGVANGQDVTVFAVGAGVDVLRKGAGAAAQPEANISRGEHQDVKPIWSSVPRGWTSRSHQVVVRRIDGLMVRRCITRSS